MNEHLEARDLNHRRELDFTNIVASCTTKANAMISMAINRCR
ncbi:MAG: hypothetical protein ACI8WB_006183 [Phenylobacterium sp.]|jgi:hypothetical protein